MHRERLVINERDCGSVCLLECSGRLISGTAAILVEAAFQTLSHCESLVVNLRRTEVVDAAGLGALVLVHRCASLQGKRVVYEALGSNVAHLVTLTGLDAVLTIEPGEYGERATKARIA